MGRSDDMRVGVVRHQRGHTCELAFVAVVHMARQRQQGLPQIQLIGDPANHTAAFKAKVAVAALRGDKTLIQLAQQFNAHANQIMHWKTQWLDRAKDSFDTTAARSEKAGPSVKDRQAKIGQ